MARPIKNSVDYFPHMTTHKKTMFILESRFGNNGYAFWFKLLEVLGGTENHVFDTKIPEDMLFLATKTRLNEDTCFEILNLLANLKAIDSNLWKLGLVWSQNFVDGVADVYKKRRRKIPQKPSYQEPDQGFSNQKPESSEVFEPETTTQKSFCYQHGTESTQSKVKESKRKESKGNDTTPRNYFQNPDSEAELITQKIILWNNTFTQHGFTQKIPTDDVEKRGILIELMNFTLEEHQRVYEYALTPGGWANKRMKHNLVFETVHNKFSKLLEQSHVPDFDEPPPKEKHNNLIGEDLPSGVVG